MRDDFCEIFLNSRIWYICEHKQHTKHKVTKWKLGNSPNRKSSGTEELSWASAVWTQPLKYIKWKMWHTNATFDGITRTNSVRFAVPLSCCFALNANMFQPNSCYCLFKRGQLVFITNLQMSTRLHSHSNFLINAHKLYRKSSMRVLTYHEIRETSKMSLTLTCHSSCFFTCFVQGSCCWW